MKQNSILNLNDLKKKPKLDYVSSIWYAIMEMDSFMLNNLLNDDMTYEDISKKDFIEKLNDRFNNHKTLGDSELLMDLDHCKSCNCNQPVCKFIGNNSGDHFALYFEFKDGEVSDIYHCNWYGGCNPFLP